MSSQILRWSEFLKVFFYCGQVWPPRIYTNTVILFSRINPLSLVQIITPVVAVSEDKAEALAFVDKIANKVKKDTEAFILTKVIEADIQLNHYNNREKVKVRHWMDRSTLLVYVQRLCELFLLYYYTKWKW